MKTLTVILIMTGGLMYCSIGRANILYVGYAAEGGAITCPTNTVQGNGTANLSLNIQGTETAGGAAQIRGTIITSTTSDPALTINSAIVNDTTFTWTAYQVNVYMNNSFTLSGETVTLPADWAATITQAPAWNGTQYEGKLLFTAGTPVMVGDELDFGYTVNFSGATSFVFTQEMTPVPEPATFGFLAMGAVLLGRFLVAGRRERHS